MMAFVLDIGYLLNSRVDIQRCVDSVAVAAAWELLDLKETFQYLTESQLHTNMKLMEGTFVSYNNVGTC